jgi:tRNA A-37 threonylcarbamoyl transferase component Bud32
MSPDHFGRYRVVRAIGAGAMGQVFEGFDPAIERRVAIKTIRMAALSDEMVAEFQARFRAEMRAAGRLAHPNIVGLFDAGQDDGLAYIVMEFVDGEDLKQRLDRGDVFTPAQAVEMLRQLLDAVSTAHARGIVHRDIKPANILLQRQGLLKLADFGIARLQGGDATHTRGGVVGTVRYASPEQISGDPVDGRSDLFSCGVVLYRLLTGSPPFDGPSEIAVMRAVLHDEPPAPSTLNPALPRALDAIVLRALAKRPEARWPDAGAFAAALAPFGAPAVPLDRSTGLENADVRAGAPRRRGARVAVAAVLLFAGAGVAGWYLVGPGRGPPPRAAGFDGGWTGLFACGERLGSQADLTPGGNPFSEKVDVRVDHGRITWARKRGTISETITGTIAPGGNWQARGLGVDSSNGNQWLTAGGGVYNTSVAPPRLDGDFTIATPDGRRIARRCSFGAVRVAAAKR